MDELHEKLDAWREAVNLTIDIYQATDEFLKGLRSALTEQIHRATLCVASHIDEGAARQTKKVFTNYLRITQTSLDERDTHLEVAKRLQLLEDGEWSRLDAQMNHIDKLLPRLIRHHKSGESSSASFTLHG